jgi:uncharacterized membrane protein
VVAAVLIGLASAFLRPPLSGTDEFAHFMRTLTLSRGQVVPATSDTMAEGHRIKRCEWYLMAGIFGTYQKDATEARPHFGDQFRRTTCDAASSGRMSAARSRSPASDVNPPTVFLPAAVGYRIVEPIWGPLLGTLGARLVQLAVGVALTWLALRILPRGHGLMVVIALVPTVAQVNGLVSPDAVANAAVFIWFALLLRTIDESTATGTAPGRGRTLQLVAAAVGLALAKPFLAPLLFAIFMLPLGRPRRRREFARAAGIIAPAAILVAGWYLAVVSRLGIVVPLRGADSARSAEIIRQDPLSFLRAVVRGLTDPTELRRALNEVVEITLGKSPGNWATAFALVAVVAMGLAWWGSRGTGRFVSPPAWDRRAFVAALIVVELLVIEYGVAISWDVPGTSIVTGLQGRYLLPLIPLAYLATRARAAPPDRARRAALVAAVGLVVVANLWSLASASAGIYA